MRRAARVIFALPKCGTVKLCLAVEMLHGEVGVSSIFLSNHFCIFLRPIIESVLFYPQANTIFFKKI
ncbi:MAG: hypothetical protein DRP52_03940 [Planctomycetota bacterium]|nr:MAG: hypothetical protein DRP52_03940 [Planctomycetota bacterium]